MKRGQKASQRRLETKGERGLQIREIRLNMRVKKVESTAQKMVEEEDGKGLQKVETKRQKRAVQKGENVDSEQKEGKAANKRPKRLKVQPKGWPQKRMERGCKKWKEEAKEGCPKSVRSGEKWTAN